ncbi:MAG: hypothetical protein ACXQS2_04480 [Methermicoccaceae archaeon]
MLAVGERMKTRLGLSTTYNTNKMIVSTNRIMERAHNHEAYAVSVDNNAV